jgi:hypothetical protein
MPPARLSFQRLAKRLPLIEKLASGGQLNPLVFAKILEAAQNDLAVLSDPKQLKTLAGAERKKAETAREQTRLLLDRLKNRLKPMALCYYATPQASRGPQGWRVLAERARRIDALERSGTLRPPVAAKARDAVERERASHSEE